MADFIECEEKTTEPIAHERIKAFNPQIVVSDHPDKLYYNISYYDIAKKEWYIGYGSYDIKNVYKWLFECFEEVDSDMVEVVRCKDCKHWCTVDCAPNYGSCSKLEDRYKEDCKSSFDETTRFDDFCSYGERKDNG